MKNKCFQQVQREIREDEADRIYCRHELEHGLDVCRIAWIMYLEAVTSGNSAETRHTGFSGGYLKAGKTRMSDSLPDYGKKDLPDYGNEEKGCRRADCEENPDCGPEPWEEIKDRFYVTGLLHDIGRSLQYRTGEHHSAAGAALAEQILREIDYPEDRIRETADFIQDHHGRQNIYTDQNSIGYYIERADQFSRNCFCCTAADTCKWEDEERNQTIRC